MKDRFNYIFIRQSDRQPVVDVVSRMLNSDPDTSRLDIDGFPAWTITGRNGKASQTVCITNGQLLIGWDIEQIRSVKK